MTDTIIQKAKRKSNGYKSPSTFMDGFNYALEVADKVPSTSAMLEINKLRQQNDYILQQNVLMMSKLNEANQKIEYYTNLLGFKDTSHIDLDLIVKYVCAYFKITEKQILENTRRTQIRLPRQIVSYIAQEYGNGITLKAIAHYFNQDHTTQIHARQAIGKLYDTDKKIRKAIDAICSKLLTNDSKKQSEFNN